MRDPASLTPGKKLSLTARMLARHATVDTRERRLAFAILRQAVQDAIMPNVEPEDRIDGARWLFSQDMVPIAEYIELDENFIRECVRWAVPAEFIPRRRS